MPITFAIPNTFVGQSGNVPAVQLDDNWAAIKTALSGVALASTDLPVFVANALVLGAGTSTPGSLALTKGELIVGQAAANPIAFPIGADTFVLTLDSTTAAGVKWGPASGASSVGIGLGMALAMAGSTAPVL